MRIIVKCVHFATKYKVDICTHLTHDCGVKRKRHLFFVKIINIRHHIFLNQYIFSA